MAVSVSRDGQGREMQHEATTQAMETPQHRFPLAFQLLVKTSSAILACTSAWLGLQLCALRRFFQPKASFAVELGVSTEADSASAALAAITSNVVHVRLVALPLQCWSRCHCDFVAAGGSNGCTDAELKALDQMWQACAAQGAALLGSGLSTESWPFRETAEVLLGVAERLALVVLRRNASRLLTCADMECAAYQYAFRHVERGRGGLSTVHADNVEACDAMRDFAPALLGSIVLAGDGTAARDRLLSDVTAGRRSFVRGVNVWILLEDDGCNFPLAFADVCAYPSDAATTPCQRSGTRTLDARAHTHAVYCAQPQMHPGDAYVFETWGVHAAWHVGASRVSCPPSARRRSIECRVAVVGQAPH